jgi:hypothetical protein
LCTGDKHKKSLLGGIERLLGNCSNSEEVLAAGATSKALMVLYQADIIDEETAIQWGTHVSKKYVDKDVSKKVRKSAEAFVAVCLTLLFFLEYDVKESWLIGSGSRLPKMRVMRSRGRSVFLSIPSCGAFIIKFKFPDMYHFSIQSQSLHSIRTGTRYTPYRETYTDLA